LTNQGILFKFKLKMILNEKWYYLENLKNGIKWLKKIFCFDN
jgi:hypothetical protein